MEPETREADEPEREQGFRVDGASWKQRDNNGTNAFKGQILDEKSAAIVRRLEATLTA